MIKISVLGSGSSGNATLITSGKTSILVDAGLSAKQICLRLAEVGADPDSLDAILITHEHGDHISGLDVLCKTREIPVFCTRLTQECLTGILKLGKSWNMFTPGDSFSVGSIQVTGFKVPHDAVEPVGFRFQDSVSTVGLASDIGHITVSVRDFLVGCHTVFLEANYDEDMLAEDVKRPWSTKQRIASRHGHLSNTQCAAAAVALAASGNLSRIILGHLSSDCNSPSRASEIVSRALHDAGHKGVHVLCANQKSPTALLDASPPASVAAPKIPTNPVQNIQTGSSRHISDYVQAELF